MSDHSSGMPASAHSHSFGASAELQAPVPTNLPLSLSSFVGRTSAMTELTHLVGTTRLLTLTGPGGVGKTRLALEVAGQLLPHFTDGVFLVDLAPQAEPQGVAPALAAAVGIRKEGKLPWLRTLIEVLQDRQMLLVLDNCEHLVVTCAEIALALLRACAKIAILATSREALGVDGELLWRVPSLSVPPPSSDRAAQAGPTIEAESITSYEAVQLFLERGRAVRADFRLTNANTAALVQIVSRLDGIPLAIELAAARVQALSTEQIATRLSDRFSLLTGGSRFALPRQQTLRATLDWSYGLLSEPEQTLFQRLSVFAGGWTLEAAEAVCESRDCGGLLVLDGLTQLVKKSLVVMEERAEQASYRLLETVRQYASDKLEQAGERTRLRDRHLAYFLSLVQQAVPRFASEQQLSWVQQLSHTQDNLRTAFDWAIASQKWEQGLLLCAGLWPFWEVSGRAAEGCEWLEAILLHTEQVGQMAARGQALLACGSLATQLNDYAVAQRYLSESLAIHRAHHHPELLAQALSSFGWYFLYLRDWARGRVLLEESLSLYEQVGNRSGLAISWARLGWVDFAEGHYQLARAHFEQAIALLRKLGNIYHLATTLNYLGELTRFEGGYDQAEPLYLEARQHYQALGHAPRAAMALSNLAQVARARGDLKRALALLTEALLTNIHRQGSKEHLFTDLLMVGGLAQHLGEPALTAQLYGAAERLRETYGVSLNLTDQAQYERDLAAFQQRWGEVAFQEPWQAGRALSLEQAIALVEAFQRSLQAAPDARKAGPSSSPSLAFPTYPNELTAREVEVLRLLAEGLTNKQIAERLVISPKTVNSHIESLFSKLGVNSRAAATRFAVAHQII